MSIGPWQIVLIIAIVLIFFGPKRIPGLGRSIGEAIRGFKKGISGSDEGNEKLESRDVSSAQSVQQEKEDQKENV